MAADLVLCGERSFLSEASARAGISEGDANRETTGQACRDSMEGRWDSVQAIAIGPELPDVEPINLVAALRKDEQRHSPCSDKVVPIYLFSRANVSGSLASRAGLAGATRVIKLEDAASVLRRKPSMHRESGSAVATAEDGAGQGEGAVIAIASGAGGVGKSTIALLAATSLARDGRRVALVDFDLQFGDLAYLLGLPSAHRLDELAQLPGLLEGKRIDSLATKLDSGIEFFASPNRPELGDLVSPKAAQLLEAFKSSYEFVVVNTGSFWTESHAAIAQAADAVFLVMDQRVASVHACAQALDLCGRLGVPRVRIACILNRYSPRSAVGPDDAAFTLRSASVHTIADGGREVEELLGVGSPSELFDLANPCASGVTEVLDEVLSSLGLVERGTRKRRSIPEAGKIFTFGHMLARGR